MNRKAIEIEKGMDEVAPCGSAQQVGRKQREPPGWSSGRLETVRGYAFYDRASSKVILLANSPWPPKVRSLGEMGYPGKKNPGASDHPGEFASSIESAGEPSYRRT